MRSWGLLFALVTALCVGCFIYAPMNAALWLPTYEETNVESLEALADLDSAATGIEADLRAAEEALVSKDGNELERGLARASEQTESATAPIQLLLDRQFLTTRANALGSARADLSAQIAATQALHPAAPADQTRTALEQSLEAATAFRSSVGDALVGIKSELGSAPSTAAQGIDHLFIVILWITGITFILTMAVLVWCLWRFAAVPGRAAVYSHGSLPIEIGLAVAAAVPLVFITVYQLEDWAALKFRDRRPDGPPIARVSGYQFGWKVRYPGDDGRFETADDLVRINDLHFIKGEPTLIELDSQDVVHSFSLPQLRVKQDAMPGLRIPVWFDATRAGRYELLCAELCGWGHYKMRADVIVHETRDEFDAWHQTALAVQNRDRPDDPEAE